MADSRQFKSTDTITWAEKYGSGVDGVGSIIAGVALAVTLECEQ
jgi:hypothetical protein